MFDSAFSKAHVFNEHHVHVLLSKSCYVYVTSTNKEGVVMIHKSFDKKNDIPQVCGTTDRNPVEVDILGASDSFNKDQKYRLILQTIVDTNTSCRDIFASFLGCIHNV